MEPFRRKKRLIVCCDGTWQSLTSVYPTNVVKIAQAIKPTSNDGTPQIIFYDEGIGSGNVAGKLMARADRILGGALGLGIDNNIQDAYRFLSLNYEKDDEIYLFGFSRGSYTVRSLAGLIRCYGLLSLPCIREAPYAYQLYRNRNLTLKEKERCRTLPLPVGYKENAKTIEKFRQEVFRIYGDRTFLPLPKKDEKIKKDKKELERQKLEYKKLEEEDLRQKDQRVQELYRQYHLTERSPSIRQDVKITLLGCWDTVGSLGVPQGIPLLNLVNQKYRFHDCELSSRIECALHAVSIDENRKVFDVTPMQRDDDDKQTLRQVWFPGGHGCVGGGSQAERELSDAALAWMMAQIKTLHLGLELYPEEAIKDVVEDGIAPKYTGEFNSKPSWFYRLLGLNVRDLNFPKDDKNIDPVKWLEDSLHESTKMRWRDMDPKYRPDTLKDFTNFLENWCGQNRPPS